MEGSEFDLEEIKKRASKSNRYDKRIAKLRTEGKEVNGIKHTIEEATRNIEKGNKSFVDQNVLDMDYVVGSGGTSHHGMRFEPSQLAHRLGYTPGAIIQR